MIRLIQPRFVISFLIMLVLGHLIHAQSLPNAANQIDSKNRRQGDWVIWLDAEFKPTTDQQQVRFYRKLTYKDDKPTGSFSDFYRSGNIQSKGKLLQDRPEDVYDGLITWYREDGSREQEVLYKQGQIIGDIKLFSKDGTLITESFEVLNSRGMEAWQQGDLLKSKRYYFDALLVVSVEYGSDHIYYATLLNNLAMIQQELGEFKVAEENYWVVLKIYARESGKEDEFYANTLNNLGTLYETTGAFKKAETMLEEALAIREKVLGAKHPDYATSLNNLGNLYIDLGLYNKAITYLERAITLKASTSGTESTEYATSISNLGLAYVSAGNYAKAEPLLIKAVSIKKNAVGVNNSEYAAAINNLGHLYSTYGNLDRAEQLFLEATDIYSRGLRKDAGYTSTLNNLAIVYKKLGNFQRAEATYLECIKSKGLLFGTTHVSYINSINNLAELYHVHGDFEKAEPLLLQVEENWSQMYGKDHPLYAAAVYNLGTLYSDMHDFPRAEPYLLEAKAIREKVLGKDHPDYITTVNSLAVLYDNENLDKQAIPYYQESIRRKIQEILNYFPSLSEAEKTKYFYANQIYFQNAEECFLSQLPSTPALAADLYNLRLVTKALLFNAVSKMRKTILNDPSLTHLFTQWQEKREYLAHVYRMSLDEKNRSEINQVQLEDEVNVLEKELSRRSELFLKTHDRKTYTWKDVQDRLAPGEAAVEIIQTQRRLKAVKKVYVVLLVKPGQNLPEVLVLENGDELENKYVRYYRNSITQKMTDTISYNQFWKPIASKLGGVSRVYVSSDGVFNQINLSTLFNKGQNRFLMDEVQVRNVTSAKDLVVGRPAIAQIHDASLFGYPNYNASLSNKNQESGTRLNVVHPLFKKDSAQRFFDGENIAELPGTRREIETIASLLNHKKVNVKTFVLEEASEDKLKNLEQPGVLHIATHGYFLQDEIPSTAGERGFAGFTNDVFVENPLLRSGLLLSGARSAFLKATPSTAENDGLLTAYEALNLNLDKTDLVVLSACETGLGVTVNGEGVYGLQRAFAVAGARYTLMSLWKVDDTATQEFMTAFYKAWLSPLNVHEALRKAQQEVRSKYPEPYYWGAFVLSGL